MRTSRAARGGAVVVAAAVAGCAGAQSALDPRGVQAERLYDLTIVLVVGSAIVFAIVIGFVAVGVLLPRAVGDDARRATARLRAVGIATGVTAAVLVALLAYDLTLSRKVSAAAPPDAVPIRVVAHQWWWDVTYEADPPSEAVRTANELWIPVGRPVAITLEARDVIHSFWVPNLHGKLDAIPGRTNLLWLQADRPGVYRGQCAEFCGLQHARMAFVVVAVPPAEFEAWLGGQRAPAGEPPDELARRGRDVFLAASCVMCHAIRGTDAAAAVGPDLTHLASRQTIAAGTLPNLRGHLGGWIADPQRVKPGVFMPGTDLDAASLHALLRYLETLE